MRRIFVDSGSSIKQEEKEQCGVEILPLHITLGEKEYLDGIVKDYKNVIKPRCLDGQVRAAITICEDVLVHEGLETVADIMGLETREEEIEARSDFVFEYSFVYEDVKFVSYEKERLARFAENE